MNDECMQGSKQGKAGLDLVRTHDPAHAEKQHDSVDVRQHPGAGRQMGMHQWACIRQQGQASGGGVADVVYTSKVLYLRAAGGGA